MLTLVLFLVCLAATTLGAVGGFGGGVIIKPVVDALGVLPVSTVSFLSACTVLCMSVVSVVRSRGRGALLEMRMAAPLAGGAAVGGVAGKLLFDALKAATGSEALLGLLQAIALVVLTTLVLLSVVFRGKWKPRQVKSPWAALVAGMALGLISSFIGIGGGPFNVALLLLLFDMDAKQAAKNSIFIVLFCQASNVLLSVARSTVPDFSWLHLGVMAAGGVGGALLGAAVSKRVSAKAVERLVLCLMVFVILTNVYNIVSFLLEL